MRFHSLPTATQVVYTDWEAQLAGRGSRLHIYEVYARDRVSEVLVGITENFQLRALETDLTDSD